MADENQGDESILFAIGTLHDGRVLIDFNTNKVDHLKLTTDQALEMAEGLAEAAIQASKHGRVIELPGFPSRN